MVMDGTTGVTAVVSDGVGATHGYGTTGVMEDTTAGAGAVTAGAVTAGAVTAGAGADIIIPITVMVMVTTANTVITEVEEDITTTILLPVVAPQDI